ncbi:thioredoxin-2 [Chrysoperla carnea]|uniref:thioredoxin-2 n=1 Tax=Chrysoperla carnea TaxID=189513 RepID=UPI001D09194A|nr:thioredoxin-2 [Chrysoperla carnea]
MATIHVKDQSEFNSKLEEAGEKLVVVDFFATWCGPCKLIAPKLEELSAELAEKIVIIKVDVDECEDLAATYNISSMPTFVFIKNKTQVDSFSGANYDKLKLTINKHIS